MKYLVLIYSDEKREAELSQEAWQQVLEQHTAFGTRYGDKVLEGEALEPTSQARTLRTVNGKKTVLDGPFAETKEQLGGYYLLDVESIDEAMRMVQDLPLAEYSSIEVRPIMPTG
ncbi:MAG: YciI family protein [Spirochaetaceae bacterium]